MRHSMEYPLSKFKLLRSMKYLFLQDLNLWKLSIQRKHSHIFLNRRQLFQVTWRKTVLKTSSIPYKPALASVHSPILFLEMQRDVQIRIWNMWVHSKTCINRDEKKVKKNLNLNWWTLLVRHWNKYNNSNNKYNWLSITDGTSTLEKNVYLLVITKCHFQVLLSVIKIAKISQLVGVVLNMFTFNLTWFNGQGK